jgi:RNA polymerase sigma-70 factor (ECF subfamily)
MFRLRRSEALPAEPAAAAAPVDPESAQDERLIRAAQRGDLASFNALVVRHERVVYGLCLRMLRDQQSAEDAAQDSFLKAWTGVKSWDGGAVRPWILRIATNRCLDLLRAQSRRPAASLDAEPYEVEPLWTSQAPLGEEPDRYAIRRELSVFLETAIARLPEDQRLVAVLADVNGLPYEEVAAIAGVPLGTVKSRLSRARARLRDLLLESPDSRELLDRFGRLDEE